MVRARSTIDFNLDLGEGFGTWSRDNDEDTLMTLASSVNLACGFHAGDPGRMRKAVNLAARLGVAVGAHPGLPDLVGFGRRTLILNPSEVSDAVTYQIGALQAFTHAAGIDLHHVKLHGELHVLCSRDPAAARAFVEAVAAAGNDLPIYAHENSEAWIAAERAGVPSIAEFYADLPMRRDGTLVPPGDEVRHGRHPSASPETVRERVRDFLTTGSVNAHDGGRVAVRAGSICVHTDGPPAVEIAAAVRAAAEACGFTVASSLFPQAPA